MVKISRERWKHAYVLVESRKIFRVCLGVSISHDYRGHSEDRADCNPLSVSNERVWSRLKAFDEENEEKTERGGVGGGKVGCPPVDTRLSAPR